MRVPITGMAAIIAFALFAQPALSQPPGGRGSGRPPRNMMAEALDADGDSVISAAELANAATALKSLDRNGDGQLTEAELRPTGDGRGQQRGGPGGGQRRGDAVGFVDRLLGFDDNEDGNVSKDELPERMHQLIERHDENKDGVLDRSELQQMASASGAGGGGRDGRGPGGGDGQRGEGRGGFRGPGGPGGGPPSPEQFLERALSFDADDDGKLSADELAKMAESFTARGPQGRDGQGRGGPRDGGGRPGDRGRPQRPARPDSE